MPNSIQSGKECLYVGFFSDNTNKLIFNSPYRVNSSFVGCSPAYYIILQSRMDKRTV